MEEVVQVAKARGLKIPDGIVPQLIKSCTDINEGIRSSMPMDHLEHRPMEVEVILVRL